MPTRRGGSLASATPGAPAEGSARRLAVWHRSAVRAVHSGALYPAGQSSSRGEAGGAELLTAAAVSLFGLSPDS